MMANKLRGEASLEAGDKTYTLSLSVNEICDIETKYDAGFSSVVAPLEDASPSAKRFKLYRELMGIFLRKYHPNLTDEAVGDIISDAGLESAGAAMQALIVAAFPETGTKAPGKTKA